MLSVMLSQVEGADLTDDGINGVLEGKSREEIAIKLVGKLARMSDAELRVVLDQVEFIERLRCLDDVPATLDGTSADIVPFGISQFNVAKSHF